MLKKSTLLFFLLFALNVSAEKYGLIIAIGDYPTKTGWSTISSVNDVPLIKQALLNQGFSENNISILIDAEATKEGILKAIENLKSRLKAGDIVVIHYSGHGQQIFDDNGDEIDGKDEALVPYDAWVKYTFNYKGENHLRDDELGNIIANFRNTLGSKGQLLFILDSCHSGSTTRGRKSRGGKATFAPDDWKPLENDKTKGSAMVERTKVNPDAAPFVLISGASADELNYEYEGFGSLSYAFSKAMTELGSDFTYRQLFSKIATNMNVISPKQTPTIEGDMDYKLFNGEYVQQQPYFEIAKIPNVNLIHINAGKIQGLFEGTTVKIVPSGTTKVTDKNTICTGTITKSNFNLSIIKLDKSLSSTNTKEFWVIIDKQSYGDIAIKVYFDKTIKDNVIKTGVTNYLKDNNLGTIVTDTLKADVILNSIKNAIELRSPSGIGAIDTDESTRGATTLEDINKKLFNFAQGQYLKNLSLKNQAYEMEFKLLPVNYSEETKKAGDLIEVSKFINEAGIFEVVPEKDHVVLQITNKSKKALYVSIIEINSKGEIFPFMPNDNCSLTNDERKLSPGQTMIFKDCVYSFGPPYERLILKGFATTTPINFQSTVATRGEGSRNSNPLENFIQQSYTQSRGATGNSTNSDVDGFTTEFVYEIVKK
ncbi:caspase family protein [uncultured Flavobacterium sp.]|uniref:caspase family protein n=1 Tax=uncultured Flavobacterium sp. TaxID=165435 RepID=UPI0030EC5628|tara:strand:- start:8266 stop:10227 length:1962 start_codon:yes stop_codon:yes gene_type:complete